jgi:O-antigen/teichoic acid export membrane protein
MLLIAPEFIRIALGDKWLPMLTTFRLLLIFALLEPLRSTVSDLFLAVGAPTQLVWTRMAQLGVLIVGLFVLGSQWGIEGAAVAVNLMILLGIGVMLYRARQYVRFSLLRLFLAPSLALLLALLAASIALHIPGVQGVDWRTAATKIITFSGVYLTVLWLLEGKSLQAMLSSSFRLIFSDRPGQTQPPKDADNGALS